MNKTNNLTIADIHNIRYENYEETKNLSFEELLIKTSEKAQAFKKELGKYAEQQTDLSEICIAAEQPFEYKTKNP